MASNLSDEEYKIDEFQQLPTRRRNISKEDKECIDLDSFSEKNARKASSSKEGMIPEVPCEPKGEGENKKSIPSITSNFLNHNSQSTFDEQAGRPKVLLNIEGMCRVNGIHMYRVKVGSKVVNMLREDILKRDYMALILFYERHLRFQS